MIPKTIHYCWFGRKPLPESASKCIESWKKFFPDYEIREWNEDNFDINIIPYTKNAYEAKKYAFVSDYARFWILEKFGGLYFDTDVEVIKSMESIIAEGAFLGAEIDGEKEKGEYPKVAPGLCIGAYAHMTFYQEVLKRYDKLNFWGEDGRFNKYTMIPLVTDLLKELGMQESNTLQKVGDITIYPAEYFNPLDIGTGELHVSPNTRSIHWFMASWLPPQPVWKKKIKQYIRRLLRLFR